MLLVWTPDPNSTSTSNIKERENYIQKAINKLTIEISKS